MLFGVCIPVFKEGSRCLAVFDEVITELRKHPQSFLIIVEDGSHEQYRSKIRNWHRDLKESDQRCVKLLMLETNLGFGGANKAGLNLASENGLEYLIFMDSDGTNHPKDISRFVAILGSGDIALVKASRFSPGGGMVGIPIKRLVLSKLANLFARFCFWGYCKDPTNGFRMINVSLAHRIIQSSVRNDFSYIVEEMRLIKLLGGKCLSLPVVLSSRKGDDEKSKFSYSMDLLSNYIGECIKGLVF